jgi:hypothetical protein
MPVWQSAQPNTLLVITALFTRSNLSGTENQVIFPVLFGTLPSASMRPDWEMRS